MIRIAIPELQKHRNECLFRPFIMCQDLFRDSGIHLNYTGNSYDYLWIGQASYTDKSTSLSESTEKGLEYLSKIDGDYWLFDGQDSASLIGTYDVFLKSKARFLLKNTLYSNKNDYSLPFINGRSYWGMSYIGYKVTDFSRFNDVKLSGTNWLSTISPNWFNYAGIEKPIDVFAMFSYPARENYEFGLKTSIEYDVHRSRCIEELKKLPRNIKIQMLERGQKVPLEQYYNLMSKSKIIVAPFGYGEIAPRDIEAAMVGSILIKPNMEHLNTFPNCYVAGKTYIDVLWNFTLLREEIITVLERYEKHQNFYVENMRKEYIEQYNPTNLVTHIYNLIKNLPGIESE